MYKKSRIFSILGHSRSEIGSHENDKIIYSHQLNMPSTEGDSTPAGAGGTQYSVFNPQFWTEYFRTPCMKRSEFDSRLLLFAHSFIMLILLC